MSIKSFLAIVCVSSLFLTGCATGRYSRVDAGSYSYFQNGVVEEAYAIELKDNGVGTVLGAVVGGVVGNQFGKGKGKTLATVAGAGAGAYAGNQLNKESGQELIIRLENGNVIKHVGEKTSFRPGDRIVMEFKDGKIIHISFQR
jgi:outer membrane lipoprotein SlyB